MSSQKAITVSVTIARPPAEVSLFVSNPENMPDWAPSFCQSIDRQEGEWVMDTPDGQARIRFVESNPYGVLDHYVTVAPGKIVYVPMRVVANGSGSEASLTFFRETGMTDAQQEKNLDMISRDLQTLKRVLEG